MPGIPWFRNRRKWRPLVPLSFLRVGWRAAGLAGLWVYRAAQTGLCAVGPGMAE